MAGFSIEEHQQEITHAKRQQGIHQEKIDVWQKRIDFHRQRIAELRHPLGMLSRFLPWKRKAAIESPSG